LKNVLKNAEKYVGGIIFLAIILLCFYGVIVRFVFKNSAGWVEEYEIFFFIWFVYLGSAACIAEDKHVAIEMLVGKYPPFMRLISDFICIGALIVVCAIVCKESLTVIRLNFERGATTIIAGLPYWTGQMAVPVGMVLIILRLILRIPKVLKNYQNSKNTKLKGDHNK